jgi:hypothetical protein
MSITGYLLSFPDPGAADMMSDHLEQVVQATGPGRIFARTTPPANPGNGPENPSGSDSRSTRMKLEFFGLEENEWVLLLETTVEGGQGPEKVVLDVPVAGAIRCKLTNMSGREGQFSLECSYEPGERE